MMPKIPPELLDWPEPPEAPELEGSCICASTKRKVNKNCNNLKSLNFSIRITIF